MGRQIKVGFISILDENPQQGMNTVIETYKKIFTEDWNVVKFIPFYVKHEYGRNPTPEIQDFQITKKIRQLKSCNLVINSAYGVEPILRGYDIPSFFYPHICPSRAFNRNYFLPEIERYYPFIRSVIAPSLDSYGYFSALGKDCYYIPIPCDTKQFIVEDMTEKEKFILWMGRDTEQKNLYGLEKIVNIHPITGWKYKIAVTGIWTEEKFFAKFESLKRKDVTVVFNPSREESIQLIRKASVYLSTSKYENSPALAIETGVARCAQVVPDVWGYRQFLPYVGLYEEGNSYNAYQKLYYNAVRFSPGKDQQDFYTRSYDIEVVRGLWNKFINRR